MTSSLSLDELTSLAKPLDEDGFCQTFPAPALVILASANDRDRGNTFQTLGAKALTLNEAHAARLHPELRRQEHAHKDVVVSFVVKSARNPFLSMITIGRAENNDVVIDHSTVSKVHAHIMKSGSQWVVDDDRSSNGTFMGDSRIEPGHALLLADGSIVRFGSSVTARFHTPEGLHRLLVSGAGPDRCVCSRPPM